MLDITWNYNTVSTKIKVYIRYSSIILYGNNDIYEKRESKTVFVIRCVNLRKHILYIGSITNHIRWTLGKIGYYITWVMKKELGVKLHVY